MTPPRRRLTHCFKTNRRSFFFARFLLFNFFAAPLPEPEPFADPGPGCSLLVSVSGSDEVSNLEWRLQLQAIDHWISESTNRYWMMKWNKTVSESPSTIIYYCLLPSENANSISRLKGYEKRPHRTLQQPNVTLQVLSSPVKSSLSLSSYSCKL